MPEEKKKYIVIADKFVEHLLDRLHDAETDGYEIVAYFQEMGVTKLLMKRNS